MNYLKGTVNVGLWYPRGDPLSLTGYYDLNFAN